MEKMGEVLGEAMITRGDYKKMYLGFFHLEFTAKKKVGMVTSLDSYTKGTNKING